MSTSEEIIKAIDPVGDFDTGRGYTSDRDPLPTETSAQGFYNYGNFFRNSVTGKVFQNIAQDTSFIYNQDGTYTTENCDWASYPKIKSSVSTYTAISLALDEERTPDENFNTIVTASFTLNSTLLESEGVNIKVAGVTISPFVLNSGLVDSKTLSYQFLVPAGQSYEIETQSGTPSLISVYELTP